MYISTDLVGQKLKPFRHKIRWRDTTNYAAGINDMNPRYIDDSREESIIAPPIYAVALSWPILENIENYLGNTLDSSILRSKLHFKEQIEFFRPMRPGDEVLIEGEIIAIKPHKTGTELIIKLPAKNAEGDLYHIEYLSALLYGVSCQGEVRDNDNSWEMHRLTTRPEKPLWEKSVHIIPEAPYIYDGCSNIFFEIHTSQKFAKQLGLPGVILQGTATMAIAMREIINQEMGADPDKLRAVSVKFTGMVFPNSTIKVQLLKRQTIDSFTYLYFSVIKETGEEVLRGTMKMNQ